MMKVKNLSLETLDQFYSAFTGDKTFLQSAPYVHFRRNCGETVLIEGYYKDETLVATAVIQKLETRIKRWLHVPHGPLVMLSEVNEFWPWWLEHYAELAKVLKMDLARVSPLLPQNHSFDFEAAGFIDSALHLVNPEKTWVLDITPSEEALLEQMKKSTRYEVRRGLKPETGFNVTIGHNLDAFWQLHEATVSRQKFVPFTRSSTLAEIAAFEEDCKIITVWHDDKALASGVFLFDDNAGYYHQGASVYSKLPAAHAYIWAAIKEAKHRGCREFNFWGVCGEEEKNHPWYGLSKFKRGFGGTEKNYQHVQDFEITWRAKLNRLIEARRRKKRGY